MRSLAVSFKCLSLAGRLPHRLQWRTALFAHTQIAHGRQGKREALLITWATQMLQIEAWDSRAAPLSPRQGLLTISLSACSLPHPCLAIKGGRGKPVVSLVTCWNSCRGYPGVQVNTQKIFPGKPTAPPGLNWWYRQTRRVNYHSVQMIQART